ncbi:hypothetical protein [Klebsiella pneumoniae]|uniref:glycine-rich domain-containing protein n=1 Tax=Klebsiella pneumoniae TaxID=573 RepID=UPI0019192B65|nr:hypothetical protein [Klebsiella pneumoniae]HBR1819110.1 hypothetical protein [Klebsiella pneumoniae]
MNNSAMPSRLTVVFSASGDKNTIPVNSTPETLADGLAAMDSGFPPLTRIALSAGGKPPKGQDFNGIFNDAYTRLQWEQAGGFYTFDSAFSAAIGGYPKGAILINSARDGFWQSTIENNTTNPDAGGAGWINALGGRLINIQIFYSSGIYTPTSGTKKVIVEMVGGGGGSAGSRAAGPGQIAVGGAGGAGSYAKGSFTQNFNGVQVTVGAKGAGGTVSEPYASEGGTSSFGSLLSAAGGAAGQPAGPTSSFPFSTVAAVVSAGANGANIIGTPGQGASASIAVNESVVIESPGGSSQFGAGGFITAFNTKGINGSGYGAGGGPSKVNHAGAAVGGGDGSQGIVIIYEYS